MPLQDITFPVFTGKQKHFPEKLFHQARLMNFVLRREMYVLRRETYISRRELQISRREIKKTPAR